MKKICRLFILVFALCMLAGCQGKKEYKMTFLDENKNVLVETMYQEGTKLNFPSFTENDQYELDGWYDASDKKVDYTNTVAPAHDETYHLVVNKKKYTYEFRDFDGTVLAEGTLEYGATIPAPANPERTSSESVTYTFTGWDKEVTTITANIVFTATYDEDFIMYTFKFVNDDGSVIAQGKMPYGSVLTEPEAPSKEATAEFTYTFTGWDKEVSELVADVTYTAVYEATKRSYTYKFVDEDGTVLKEQEAPYGTLPEAPANPSKESDDKYDYAFAGWDKDIVALTGEVTYTAVYEKTEKPSEPEPPTLFETLENKKVSFLGDSISTFYSPDSTVNSYYSDTNTYYYPTYSKDIKTVDKTWWYQLMANTKMTLGINNSWSGSTATGTGNSAGCSDARVNTLDENGTPDIVIIYLGTNDCYAGATTEELMTAFETIVTKIKKTMNPEIFFVTLGYSAYTGGKYTDERRVGYNTATRAYCEKEGFGIIPLDEYVDTTNYSIYLNDYLHYNYKGATLLSLVAEKALCEYNNIAFNKTIEVEHIEELPEGVKGKVTVTANTGFWTTYVTDVFIYSSSEGLSPTFSTRIELTEKDGKYYVTNVIENGKSGVTYNSDYVIIISSGNSKYGEIMEGLKNVTKGNIAEFNPTDALPYEITFKEGDGNGPSTDTPQEVVKPMLNDDGSLHVSLYNQKIWSEYNTKAAIYTYDQMQVEKGIGNYFTNFCILHVTKESGDTYTVSSVKAAGTTESFPTCDYYIIIFAGTPGETFFKTIAQGNKVSITGSIETGNCDVKKL